MSASPGPPESDPREGELARRDELIAELAVLRCLLRGESEAAAATAREDLAAARSRLAATGSASGLQEISDGFGLTAFERSVLLLAAGPELLAAVGEELTAATGTAVPLTNAP